MTKCNKPLSEDNSVETMLAKQFELQACKIRGTDGCFTFCFEGEGVGLANVAYRLLQERPDALELVKRIHLERVDLLFGDAEPRLRSHHATGLRKRMKRPDQYVL